MWALALLYVVLNVTDYLLTWLGIQAGHTEASLIGAFLPAKLTCTALVLTLTWLAARQNRHLAMAILIAANLFYLLVVGWNVMVLLASPA